MNKEVETFKNYIGRNTKSRLPLKIDLQKIVCVKHLEELKLSTASLGAMKSIWTADNTAAIRFYFHKASVPSRSIQLLCL